MENEIDSNGSSITKLGLKKIITEHIITPIDYIRSPIMWAKAAYIFWFSEAVTFDKFFYQSFLIRDSYSSLMIWISFVFFYCFKVSPFLVSFLLLLIEISEWRWAYLSLWLWFF